MVAVAIARFMAFYYALAASAPFQPTGRVLCNGFGGERITAPTRCADVVGSRPGGRPRQAAPAGRHQMSGHSKWSSIKHKKAARDSKRGKLFTKLIKEITIRARHGGGWAQKHPSAP